MSKSCTRDHLKISVGKILQTLGWNSINSTPLELLTDVLSDYMVQITRTTNNYSNEFGCTQPNLDHLGLAFRDMAINVSELEEYVKYVNFGPQPQPVPKYPISKEDHLNFLKPGSKEVVTRPVHIPEHLPPMHPLLEGNKIDPEAANCKLEEPEEENGIADTSQTFKKPIDMSPSDFKRLSFRKEEEGSRPTREISSVMMTTSGFLSPAREGKLPESRTPVTPVEPVIQTPDIVEPNKKTKVMKKVEKKKLKTSSAEGNEDKKKKTNVKWVFKSKHNEPHQNAKTAKTPNTPLNENSVQNKANQQAKVNKALAAARLKTEKLNTTITPITLSSTFANNQGDNVDKLFSEPDKKKVNIFKKISNVKNEKVDVKMVKKEDIKQESRESSPDLIIDEPDEVIAKFPQLSSDITIEPINTMMKSPEKTDSPYFDDDSQPGTPSTPKTPEMISHSPPIIKEKRKRKENKKIPRNLSPHRLDNDVMDVDMERPKTPEPHVLPKLELPPIGSLPIHGNSLGSLPFPFNFGGPGLIPAPLNGLMPSLPFPPMNLYNFGQKQPPLPFHPKLTEITPSQDINPMEVGDAFINKIIPEKLPPPSDDDVMTSPKVEKKNKEHKKEKKDKVKKRNKKDKIKNKAEKKKLKEEKKEKIKKEKKEKRNKEKEMKEGDSPGVKITLKIKSPSPRPETKLNIKPVVKKEEPEVASLSDDRVKRETSPGLAKISALVCGPPKPKPVINSPKIIPPTDDTAPEEFPITPSARSGLGPGRPRIHPIKPKPSSSKPKKRRTPIKKDSEGNEVWICPGCGSQDDGSPMIGCDGCDAWYHWVCVGIQVPPDDSEDWYCRHCLLKKNEDLQTDKQKKKRKKKEKKEHI